MYAIPGFPDVSAPDLPGTSLLAFVSDLNGGYPGELLSMFGAVVGLAVAAFGAVDLFMFEAEYAPILLPVGLVVLVVSVVFDQLQKRKGPLWVRILRDPARIQRVRMIQFVDKVTQEAGGTEVELVHPLGTARVRTIHAGPQFMQAVAQMAPHAFAGD